MEILKYKDFIIILKKINDKFIGKIINKRYNLNRNVEISYNEIKYDKMLGIPFEVRMYIKDWRENNL